MGRFIIKQEENPLMDALEIAIELVQNMIDQEGEKAFKDLEPVQKLSQINDLVRKHSDDKKPHFRSNGDRPFYPTNARMHSEMTGVTKREMFAAMALEGLCHDGEKDQSKINNVRERYTAIQREIDAMTDHAIVLAESLLKGLEG